MELNNFDKKDWARNMLKENSYLPENKTFMHSTPSNADDIYDSMMRSALITASPGFRPGTKITNLNDSPVTAAIRLHTEIETMQDPLSHNPYQNTMRARGVFKTTVNVKDIDTSSRESSNNGISNAIVEAVKDEILAIAREIVKERKGLV